MAKIKNFVSVSDITRKTPKPTEESLESQVSVLEKENARITAKNRKLEEKYVEVSTELKRVKAKNDELADTVKLYNALKNEMKELKAKTEEKK